MSTTGPLTPPYAAPAGPPAAPPEDEAHAWLRYLLGQALETDEEVRRGTVRMIAFDPETLTAGQIREVRSSPWLLVAGRWVVSVTHPGQQMHVSDLADARGA